MQTQREGKKSSSWNKMIRLRVKIAGLTMAARDNVRTKTERRGPTWQALLPCFAKERRLGQREYHDFFAGDRADVVMQAHHLDAGHILDHGFHDRPRRFDEVDSHLLEQVSSLLGWKRCDQLLFCHGQDAFESDDEKIADQISVNILGPRPM